MNARGVAGRGATGVAVTIPSGKSLILLRTMAAATSHINVIRYTQDARKKRQSIMALVGYAVLGVLGASMIGATACGMAYSEYARMVPVMAAAAVSAMTLIFTMLIAALLFGETITIPNIIGSVIIVTGIVFLARA